LSKEKKLFIQEKAKLNVPDEFKEEYLNVLFKNLEAISEHKNDLGQTETLMHDISLKSQEPVYVKQFKIPDAHREQVKQGLLGQVSRLRKREGQKYVNFYGKS
jgi:hypothetical protein